MGEIIQFKPEQTLEDKFIDSLNEEQLKMFIEIIKKIKFGGD